VFRRMTPVDGRNTREAAVSREDVSIDEALSFTQPAEHTTAK